MDEVPKVIWTLWLQGWQAAPPIVTACAESWCRLNPDWEVRALDEDSVRDWLPELRDHGAIPRAAFSDLIRLELLSRYGGVWVDATAFCWRPLDHWLPQVTANGFFAFRDPAPDRPLASWFLASKADDKTMVAWSSAARAYWDGRDRADAYFWVHELFTTLIKNDRELADLWRGVPTLKADGPHYFVPYGKRLTGRMTRRAKARLADKKDPLYKLTYRVDSRAEPGSAFAVFMADQPVAEDRSTILCYVDQVLERVRWAIRDTLTWTKARVKV